MREGGMGFRFAFGLGAGFGYWRGVEQMMRTSCLFKIEMAGFALVLQWWAPSVEVRLMADCSVIRTSHSNVVRVVGSTARQPVDIVSFKRLQFKKRIMLISFSASSVQSSSSNAT